MVPVPRRWPRLPRRQLGTVAQPPDGTPHAACDPAPSVCSAEAAIGSGALARLAADLRARLAQLARSDYAGHALLQAKKQVRARGRGKHEASHTACRQHAPRGRRRGPPLSRRRPRRCVQAMVVDLMRACDAADALARDPPASPRDWAWARQLRFYAEPPPGGKVRGGARRRACGRARASP